MFFHTFLFLYFSLIFIDGNQWNYGQLGPDIWSDYYPLCAGKSQSPINILTACTVYKKFSPFQFTSSYDEKHYFTLRNNGHTVIATLNTDYQQSPLYLTGGGLNGTFEFVNFHLHWGENYKSGSEHQINGVKYTGEIHFVYLNRQTSQMAVLGIFMESHLDTDEIHLDTNDLTRLEWQRYFNISQVLVGENDTVVSDLNLTILKGINFDDFWRYQGSLTTPPCTEGVIWTMFKQPIVFMESQFRILRDHIYFEDYRGPQPVYNRTVYRSFPTETLTTIPDYNHCLDDLHRKYPIEKKISIFAANHIHDWDYGEHGPAVWSELYSTCGGEHQSPINILTACTNYSSIPQFNFSYGYNELHNFTLTNNGHTIVGTYNNESKLPTFRIQGGGLNGTYEFVNFHLHWGENHKSGSEHEINGESYPGEIHFVYHNALVNHNAVLGIFMRSLYPSNQTYASNLTVSDEKTQKEWRKFFNQTQTLIQEDNSTVMSLNLAFLMGQNFDEFWRYEGSLTTPPCTENVLWTLFRKPIVFGEDEFESFRQHVYFEDYRRPQPLYTRSVYRNFHNEILSSIPDYNYCQGKSIEQQMSNKITNIHDSIHWVLFLFLIFIKTFSIV